MPAPPPEARVNLSPPRHDGKDDSEDGERALRRSIFSGVGGRKTAARSGRGIKIGQIVFCVGFAVIGLVAAYTGAAGAAGSASSRAQAHTTFWGDALIAVVGVAAAVVCMQMAFRIEHQLRGQAPGGWDSVGPTGGFLPVRTYREGGRTYSPNSVGFALLLFTGMLVGLLVATVRIHGEGERSTLVQLHGIERLATVTAVHSIYHSTKSSGYYTTDLDATFSPPLDSQTTTVIHFPGTVDQGVGANYRVLLDPRNPGYSELPGAPATKSDSWVFGLGIASLLAVLDARFARIAYRMRRQFRGQT